MQSKCNNDNCHLNFSCWSYQKPKIDDMKIETFEPNGNLTCDYFVDIDDVDVEEVQEPFINGFEVEL